MNKFFIRKEAAVPGVAGLGAAGRAALAYKPGAAQALPNYYGNPGQPAAWEKPIYAIQRQLNKLPSWLQRRLGTYVKPSSKTMFNPKDNPEAYHANLYNMAKAREERIREAAISASLKHRNLLEEIQRNPWRSNTLGPYMRRANHQANMLNEQLFDAGKATYLIGEPGSLEAVNTIDDIKYGKPVKY